MPAMMNINRASLALWGAVLIIAFCPLTVDSSPSTCKRFSDFANQDDADYYCDPQCLVSSSTDEGDVFGNKHYSQDSEICLAAKHAGVYFASWGDNVFFTKDRVPVPFVIEGSVRNGVVSMNSGNATSTFRFPSVTTGFDVQSCPNGRTCDRNSYCVQQDKICDLRSTCDSQKKMCNGVQDCLDNTDEMKCVGVVDCRRNEFSCGDNTCIPNNKKCDGIQDCTNNSDEDNCHTPRTPTLSLEESLPHGLRFSWTLPADSPPADRFDVSYQLLLNKACANPTREEIKRVSTTSNSWTARRLDSYSRYKICVASVNDKGRSTEDCENYDTGNDVPQVTLDQQQCTPYSYGSTKCQSRVGDCKKANGPGFAVTVELSTFLECEGTSKTSVLHLRAEDIDRRNVISATTFYLIPGQDYEATMTPVNEAGEGTPVTTSFTTRESNLLKVTGLRAEAHSSSEVCLTVNEHPCPKDGRITSYAVKHRIGNSEWERASPIECPTTDTSRRCLAVSNLIPGTTYTFGVALRNTAGIGTYSQVTVTTKDAEPGSPTLDSLTRKGNSVIVHLSLPLLMGKKPENCRIELSKDINITSDVPSSRRTQDIEINNLEQGRRYEGKVVCCNKIGCGGGLDIRIFTRPSKATFTSKIVILSTTNSSITVNLPKMKVEGDGKRFIHILVQHIGGDNKITNFTAEYIRLRDTSRERMKRSSMLPRRREKRQSTCTAPNETYIAGTVDENGGEFVVGAGTSPNCPLLPKEKYRIAAVGEVNLDGESSFTEDIIIGTAESEVINNLLIILPVIITLFLLLILILISVWKKCVVRPPVAVNNNQRQQNVPIQDLDVHRIAFEAGDDGYLHPIMPRQPEQQMGRDANMGINTHRIAGSSVQIPPPIHIPPPLHDDAQPPLPRPLYEDLRPPLPRPLYDDVQPPLPRPLYDDLRPSLPRPLYDDLQPPLPCPLYEDLRPPLPRPLYDDVHPPTYSLPPQLVDEGMYEEIPTYNPPPQAGEDYIYEEIPTYNPPPQVGDQQ